MQKDACDCGRMAAYADCGRSRDGGEVMLQQIVGLEYQVIAMGAAPLTSLVLGWLFRLLSARARERGAASYAGRLVAWAQQAIPDKSARYHEVAALLARRFPMLSGEQLEVLIESEVHAIKSFQPTSSQPSAFSDQPKADR